MLILICVIGSFQKTSIPPSRRKLEVYPPTPFGCPNTFTIIRNNFVSPPPPEGRNFLRVGGVWIFSGTTHSDLFQSQTELKVIGHHHTHVRPKLKVIGHFVKDILRPDFEIVSCLIVLSGSGQKLWSVFINSDTSIHKGRHIEQPPVTSNSVCATAQDKCADGQKLSSMSSSPLSSSNPLLYNTYSPQCSLQTHPKRKQ